MVNWRDYCNTRTDHGRLTMENSLQADVQQLQKRLTENLKMSSMAQGDPSSEAHTVVLTQSRRAASCGAWRIFVRQK